jgi:hypothetical protein
MPQLPTSGKYDWELPERQFQGAFQKKELKATYIWQIATK